jgi:hypothetical protein
MQAFLRCGWGVLRASAEWFHPEYTSLPMKTQRGAKNMKVYELMAALSSCNAGAIVSVQRGPNLFAFEPCLIVDEGREVFLIGDGTEPGEDEPNP